MICAGFPSFSSLPSFADLPYVAQTLSIVFTGLALWGLFGWLYGRAWPLARTSYALALVAREYDQARSDLEAGLVAREAIVLTARFLGGDYMDGLTTDPSSNFLVLFVWTAWAPAYNRATTVALNRMHDRLDRAPRPPERTAP